jgi:hypothetical protein
MEAMKKRGAFTGALTIASYNWPFYAAAVVVVLAAMVVACLPALPSLLRWTVALEGRIRQGDFGHRNTAWRPDPHTHGLAQRQGDGTGTSSLAVFFARAARSRLTKADPSCSVQVTLLRSGMAS